MANQIVGNKRPRPKSEPPSPTRPNSMTRVSSQSGTISPDLLPSDCTTPAILPRQSMIPPSTSRACIPPTEGARSFCLNQLGLQHNQGSINQTPQCPRSPSSQLSNTAPRAPSLAYPPSNLPSGNASSSVSSQRPLSASTEHSSILPPPVGGVGPLVAHWQPKPETQGHQAAPSQPAKQLQVCPPAPSPRQTPISRSVDSTTHHTANGLGTAAAFSGLLPSGVKLSSSIQAQLDSTLKRAIAEGQPVQRLKLLIEEHVRMEEKQAKKRVANRQSASTSRARKKQYVEQLTDENRRLQRLSRILAILPDLVMTVVKEGIITFASWRCQKALQQDNLAGKSVLSLLPAPHHERIKAAIQSALEITTSTESLAIKTESAPEPSLINPQPDHQRTTSKPSNTLADFLQRPSPETHTSSISSSKAKDEEQRPETMEAVKGSASTAGIMLGNPRKTSFSDGSGEESHSLFSGSSQSSDVGSKIDVPRFHHSSGGMTRLHQSSSSAFTLPPPFSPPEQRRALEGKEDPGWEEICLLKADGSELWCSVRATLMLRTPAHMAETQDVDSLVNANMLSDSEGEDDSSTIPRPRTRRTSSLSSYSVPPPPSLEAPATLHLDHPAPTSASLTGYQARANAVGPRRAQNAWRSGVEGRGNGNPEVILCFRPMASRSSAKARSVPASGIAHDKTPQAQAAQVDARQQEHGQSIRCSSAHETEVPVHPQNGHGPGVSVMDRHKGHAADDTSRMQTKGGEPDGEGNARSVNSGQVGKGGEGEEEGRNPRELMAARSLMSFMGFKAAGDGDSVRS